MWRPPVGRNPRLRKHEVALRAAVLLEPLVMLVLILRRKGRRQAVGKEVRWRTQWGLWTLAFDVDLMLNDREMTK